MTGQVQAKTGQKKQDTLRIWERRYHLGARHRIPSGRRLFTQTELEHLQLVAALVASGTRIGEIATSERRTLEMLPRPRGKGVPHLRMGYDLLIIELFGSQRSVQHLVLNFACVSLAACRRDC